MGKASREKKERRLEDSKDFGEQPKGQYTVGLRELRMPPSGKIEQTVRAVNGQAITISLYPLSDENKKKILWAIDFIQAHYIPEKYDNIPLRAICALAARTCFFQTPSADVGGYKANLAGEPAVIISLRAFDLRGDDNKRELIVLVLHELLHHLVPHQGNQPYLSKSEALHDVRCYAALGFAIPAKHWANRKLGLDNPK